MGKNEELCNCEKCFLCPCGCGLCQNCALYVSKQKQEEAARMDRETEVEEFIDSWRKK